MSQLDEVGPVEGGADFSSEDQGQPLDSLEVGVLDRHDSGVGEQLLRVVVDQLPVKRISNIIYTINQLFIFYLSICLFIRLVADQLPVKIFLFY